MTTVHLPKRRFLLTAVFAVGGALLLSPAALTASTVAPVAAEKPPKEAPVGSIEVDMVGVVRTGIMAIGAETTGTNISALGLTWELDLGGNEEFAKLAREWDGKELSVRGTVTVKKGVERGQRVIVVVKKMTPLVK